MGVEGYNRYSLTKSIHFQPSEKMAISLSEGRSLLYLLIQIYFLSLVKYSSSQAGEFS